MSAAEGFRVNQNGKVTFTQGFLDRLESLLGNDFKKHCFKLNAQGEVISGRPLTARRITHIVNRVNELRNQEIAQGLANNAPENNDDSEIRERNSGNLSEADNFSISRFASSQADRDMFCAARARRYQRERGEI